MQIRAPWTRNYSSSTLHTSGGLSLWNVDRDTFCETRGAGCVVLCNCCRFRWRSSRNRAVTSAEVEEKEGCGCGSLLFLSLCLCLSLLPVSVSLACWRWEMEILYVKHDWVGRTSSVEMLQRYSTSRMASCPTFAQGIYPNPESVCRTSHSPSAWLSPPVAAVVDSLPFSAPSNGQTGDIISARHIIWPSRFHADTAAVGFTERG